VEYGLVPVVNTFLSSDLPHLSDEANTSISKRMAYAPFVAAGIVDSTNLKYRRTFQNNGTVNKDVHSYNSVIGLVRPYALFGAVGGVVHR
jgi:hypothetical protein